MGGGGRGKVPPLPSPGVEKRGGRYAAELPGLGCAVDGVGEGDAEESVVVVARAGDGGESLVVVAWGWRGGAVVGWPRCRAAGVRRGKTAEVRQGRGWEEDQGVLDPSVEGLGHGDDDGVVEKGLRG